MVKENILSIWIGNFSSENDFNMYIEESYNEDGDSSQSIFLKDFGIISIDHDFQESEFTDKKLTKDDFIGFSYDVTFIDKIDEALLIGNCIIILYDFEYSGKIENKNNVSFIGTYEYNK